MIDESSLMATVRAAMAASAQGDVEGALNLYLQASEESPGSAVPHFLRAAELAQAQRHGEAEAAYAATVLLAPELHIARFELGVLQFTSGRASMALLTWAPLLLLPDGHALKLLVQGYAELAQNHFESALALFLQGMVANTDNAALNGNIELLVAAIKRRGAEIEMDDLPARSVQGALPMFDEGPSESEAQFLLSAYQRGQGPLH
jgi:tetratricopeptide (TPR) repeat protein